MYTRILICRTCAVSPISLQLAAMQFASTCEACEALTWEMNPAYRWLAGLHRTRGVYTIRQMSRAVLASVVHAATVINLILQPVQ